MPCAISALIGGLVLTVAAVWPSSRVVAQWTQPSSVSYASFDPYCLSVIDRGTDYSRIPWGRTCEVFIGRGIDAPSYGFYASFSFHPSSDDLDTYIHRSTVTWAGDGVTFTEPFGDRLFIPTAAFTGGR